MFKIPILLIVFNRPETTRMVFDKIRQIKPAKLFIAADGPRKNRPEDIENCKKVREIIKKIDWTCQIKTLFRDENLGCNIGVSSAISWLFQHEDEGIILEDDCVPDISFFEYCRQLLEFYKNDTRIMHISGNNFLKKPWLDKDSYYFSHYPHSWGWATWKRAWKFYDEKLQCWPEVKEKKILKNIFNDGNAEFYWRMIIQKVYTNKIIAWDYRWTLSCWLQNGLSVIPHNNLVKNIGFGDDATNTKGLSSFFYKEIKSLKFPLKYPKFIIRNKFNDNCIQKEIFEGGNFLKRILQKMFFIKENLISNLK